MQVSFKADVQSSIRGYVGYTLKFVGNMYGAEVSKKVTCFYSKCSWVIVRVNVTVKTYGSRYKQCGVNPHFCGKSIKKLRKDKYWQKLLKGSSEKINFDKIN